jgi:diadenosine tetraphosphate (Ap4A) HIT family hydrolase
LNAATCPFCTLPPSRVVHENEVGVAIRDGFPISKGHTLIIARRHVGSLFDLSSFEVSGLMELLREARTVLDREHGPDGFNVGINDGAAAGQTIPHLHIHLIPRYQGDQTDPRGGVRWIFPEKADYWTRK